MFKTNRKFETVWRMIATMILLLGLLSNGAPVRAQSSSPNAPLLSPQRIKIIPDNYIVVYKQGVSATNDASEIQSTVTAQGGNVKFVYNTALNGYSAYLPAQALAAVRADPAVDYVIADAVLTLTPEDAQAETIIQPNAVWGIDRIDQHPLPLSNTYNYDKTGTGVNAYVIDTGIRITHNEFEGRATIDYDTVGDGLNGNDCDGHGTHVAGTIGSAHYGVAKNVQLHAIRVLDCNGSGTASGIIAGVDWVAANHISPAVANMSLGGYAYQPIDTAINNLISSGVVIVVAAGNSNDDACNYSPARVPNAITVGATSITDWRAYYSNWGGCVDIFAPGSDIISTWNTTNVALAQLSGTSMASPHVAGVAALYLEDHPSATMLEVRNAIIDTATRSKVVNSGTGSPNRLLYSLFGPPSPIPDLFLPEGSIADTTPTYTWSEVAGATQYRYELIKSGITLYTKTVPASVCINRICTHTPPNILSNATTSIAYKWRVQSMVNGVWATNSLYKSFNIYKLGPAFGSQFHSDLTGWTPLKGTWDIEDHAYYHSTGLYGYASSSAHAGNYATLDYQVLMKRTGCEYCANILFVRGKPAQLDSHYYWKNGYIFEYTNDRYFLVGNLINGSYSALKYWTYTTAIKRTTWNKLRVIAVGYQLNFYINDRLVWSGIDSSQVYGQVGVGMYKDGSGGTHLYVDWAKLTPFIGSGLDITSESTLAPGEIGEEMTGWDNPNMSVAP